MGKKTLLIHVGKCGGRNFLAKSEGFGLSVESVHGRPVSEKMRFCAFPKVDVFSGFDHYVLLTRDPIDRFVSVYYYWKGLIEFNEREKKPVHLDKTERIKEGFEKFDSANRLAENLFFDSEAIALMEKTRHMTDGVSSYLNGHFERLKKRGLHIIRQEFFDDDYLKFLNKALPQRGLTREDLGSSRVGEGFGEYKKPEYKKLSGLAISNLKNFYHEDYIMMGEIEKYRKLVEE